MGGSILIEIRDIVTSVQLLESIVADVSPAVLLTATDASNQMRVSSNQHLDLLLEWWSREVRTILTSVDAVVDPRVFMDMTGWMALWSFSCTVCKYLFKINGLFSLYIYFFVCCISLSLSRLFFFLIFLIFMHVSFPLN